MLECRDGRDGRTIRLSDGRRDGGQADGRTVRPVVAFIGAGNYASRVLIPAFKEAGAELHAIVASGGLSAAVQGKKAGFAFASTDMEAMLARDEVNTVVIATRHDTHARFALQALRAGKNVFVEKPLCLTLEELREIENFFAHGTHGKTRNEAVPVSRAPLLMVGFNRRFAPQVRKIKELLAGVREAKSMIMTVNAGAVPADHWTQDKAAGGGRIIGEACHFIDLLRYLADAPISARQTMNMDSPTRDTTTIHLSFVDGSLGTVHYFANGNKSFPKERLEVFADGRILQLDNFRKLSAFGWPGFKKMNLWRQDKGQKACVAMFVRALRQGGAHPIPIDQIVEVSRVTIEAATDGLDGRKGVCVD